MPGSQVQYLVRVQPLALCLQTLVELTAGLCPFPRAEDLMDIVVPQARLQPSDQAHHHQMILALQNSCTLCMLHDASQIATIEGRCRPAGGGLLLEHTHEQLRRLRYCRVHQALSLSVASLCDSSKEESSSSLLAEEALRDSPLIKRTSQSSLCGHGLHCQPTSTASCRRVVADPRQAGCPATAHQGRRCVWHAATRAYLAGVYAARKGVCICRVGKRPGGPRNHQSRARIHRSASRCGTRCGSSSGTKS